mmetsp:Transcript_7250/g.6435  ORF Transcript_7250/g.6435 Transcript_7250/m.6435 type:complete len:86 (+) Transcript_7250:487-744(+)
MEDQNNRFGMNGIDKLHFTVSAYELNQLVENHIMTTIENLSDDEFEKCLGVFAESLNHKFFSKIAKKKFNKGHKGKISPNVTQKW